MRRPILVAALLTLLAACAAARSISVGFADGFPPYQFVDEHGKPAGLDIDIAEALFRQMGVKGTIIQGSWDDMVNMLRRGLVLDLVGGMEMSDGRLDLFDFTRPIYRRKSVIVVPASNTTIEGIADLPGLIITGDRGSYGESLLDLHGYRSRIRIAETESKEAAMDMLKDGRASASIMPDAVAVYLAKRLHVAIRIVDIGDKGTAVAFAAPKGRREWLARVDAALSELEADGEIGEILEKWLK